MLLKRKKCPNCRGYYDPTLEKCPICYKRNELYLNRQLPKSILFLHPIAQICLFLGGFAFVGMLILELILALCLYEPLYFCDDKASEAILISLTYFLMTVVFSW